MHFVDPLTCTLQMGLKEGMTVGDFGTGTGHYAFSLAHIVGESGKVYAVDVQQDLLRRLAVELPQRGFSNIEIVWGDIERLGGTKLKDATLDAVVLSNTLFQLSKKDAAIAELKRVLKPSGKLLIVDWSGAHGGLGPAEENVVPEETAEAIFTSAGFKKLKSCVGGPHHYSLLFTLA